jgi:hypothetical protein
MRVDYVVVDIHSGFLRKIISHLFSLCTRYWIQKGWLPLWRLRRCQTFILLFFNYLSDLISYRLCGLDTAGASFPNMVCRPKKTIQVVSPEKNDRFL